jgi:hypothetical protein
MPRIMSTAASAPRSVAVAKRPATTFSRSLSWKPTVSDRGITLTFGSGASVDLLDEEAGWLRDELDRCSLVVRLVTRQQAAGTRPVHETEHARTCAITADIRKPSEFQADRARECPAVSAVTAQNLHGKEAVPGSSPGEGLKPRKAGF